MKTKNLLHVNSVLSLALFMVLCPGWTEALAQSDQAKAQLHVPWTLLSERLRTLANLHSSDGSDPKTVIENRLISVPYEGESINWNLTSGTVEAVINVDKSVVNASSANVSIKSSAIKIVLDQINVDQVIERDIGGVKVRVHLSAACGPITLSQPAASAIASFAIDWSTGSPNAALSALDLSWAPQSWTFSDFTCTGPSGLDQLVHDGIASYLRDPADFKSYVASYIADNLKTEVDSVLAKIRSPFTIGTGTESVSVSVGVLAPVSTGVIGDITLKTDSKATSLPPGPLPTATLLSSLSKAQPSLIGDISVIEFIVQQKLAAQPESFRLNLQTVKAFHDLMQSRFLQFFAWADLLNYPKNAPFYLNLSNPHRLELTLASGNALSSTIPIRSVIQSYRDSQWWSWVNTTGNADVTVGLSVKSGLMSYATTIDSLNIKSEYGDAYRKTYNKKSTHLPDDVVAKSMQGPQASLSGSMAWPDVDLGAAGTYRASGLSWVNKTTFSLNFTAVK